jgi:hypothetical protein
MPANKVAPMQNFSYSKVKTIKQLMIDLPDWINFPRTISVASQSLNPILKLADTP